MALAKSGWSAIIFQFFVFSHFLFLFYMPLRQGRKYSQTTLVAKQHERMHWKTQARSQSHDWLEKRTSRIHFGASPFASPMAYRLALAEGMPSLSHAQSTPSVLPALIFSRPRLEINFYILGSIPMFDDIQTRATSCNNKGSAGLYGDYTWGPRRYHFHLAGFHH